MIDAVVRVTVLLAGAWLITALMRRAAASTRHLVWTVAVIGSLAMPLLTIAVPPFAVLPVGSKSVLPAGAFQSTPIVEARPENLGVGSSLGFESSLGVGSPLGVGIRELAVLFWLAVAAILLVRIAFGIAAVRRIARHARPVDARWSALLSDARAELHVTLPIRVGVSSDVTMPITCGQRRPILLLPDAAREWSDERARVVLLHELAHIARRDWMTNLLARVLAALHWFNPLAWVALRRMTAERERACDNCVLTHGAHAADYASHLLEIARAQLTPRFASAALAMARPSELEGRLLSILTPRPRHSSKLAAVTLATLAAGLSVAVAAAGSAASPLAEQTSKQPAPARPPRTPSIYAANAIAAQREQDRHTHVDVKPLAATALHDDDEGAREEATLALALRSDPSVVDALLAALKDESSQVREKAALGLSLRRDPRVVDALIQAAGDPDGQVREKVILALSLSGDRRALSTIMASLKDPDPQVREKAVSGLTLFEFGKR